MLPSLHFNSNYTTATIKFEYLGLHNYENIRVYIDVCMWVGGQDGIEIKRKIVKQIQKHNPPADYETFVPSGDTSANQSAQLNIDAVPDYESIVFLDLSNHENIIGREESGSHSAELSNPTPD